MNHSCTHDVPFTVREAAEFWRVGRSTVWSWIKRAKLQPVGLRDSPGNPLEYRFGDLAAAEARFRSSGTGRPRSKHHP